MQEKYYVVYDNNLGIRKMSADVLIRLNATYIRTHFDDAKYRIVHLKVNPAAINSPNDNRFILSDSLIFKDLSDEDRTYLKLCGLVPEVEERTEVLDIIRTLNAVGLFTHIDHVFIKD